MSKKLVLVLGFNTKCDHMVSVFKQQGFDIKICDLQAQQIFIPGVAFFFVSNFRNLLTGYEKEYLNKHSFIRNIVAVDPDFDEYEDVAVDFGKRYENLKLIVYDDRAFSPGAASIFTKDQIDLIHSQLNSVCNEEISRILIETFSDSIEAFSNDVKNIGRKYLSEYGTTICSLTNAAFRPVESFCIEKSRYNSSDERTHLDNERSTFLADMNWKVIGAKIAALIIYSGFILGDYFYYNWQNSGSMLNDYLTDHKFNLILYTSIFTAIQLCLIISSMIIGRCVQLLTINHERSLKNYFYFSEEILKNHNMVEEFKTRIKKGSEILIEECLKYPEKNKFVDIIENKKLNCVNRYGNKAA